MKKLLLIILLIVGCSLFTKKGTCIVDNIDYGCIGGNCWCWDDMTLDECEERAVSYNKRPMITYYEEPNDISCADYCVLESVRDACINYPPP